MRWTRFGIGVALCVLGSAVGARAQTSAGVAGVLADPFTFYYGVYLPRQAALASQPRVGDTIAAYSAARQYSALTQRAGLSDPYSMPEPSAYDPMNPFGTRAPQVLPRTMATGGVNMNVDGHGPAQYYDRAAAYHPGSRGSQFSNSFVYQPKANPSRGASRGLRGGGGGGGGMR